MSENTINSCKKEEIDNPVWRYSDNIRLGDKITEDNQTRQSRINNRQLGDTTAYALAIEANFMADKIVKKPVGEKGELKDVKIDNDVKNFIYYDKDSKKQRLIVGKDEIYTISPRTKLFVNRYELVKHIPNQKSGFSSTVFYDTAKSNYIIGFRGTEIKGNDFVDDFFMAITSRAIMQISALTSLQSSMVEAINSHSLNLNSVDGGDENSLNLNQEQASHGPKEVILSGHSLGGHLAQSFAFLYTKDVKELYTFNAPGFGGIYASLLTIALRFVSFIAKAIMKGIRWIARVLDPNGFVGKIASSIFNKIKGMFGFKDDNSTLKECVDTIKDNEKACKEVGDKEVSSNINKSSKGSHEVEIHHCDSVRHKIYDKNDEGLFDASDDSGEDSLKREWNQLYEPSTSVISDLGFRYGLEPLTRVGDGAEFDYKNTDKLHLINILVA
ncbi:DUF6792 domain-containing protein [Campylobacter concisus]|uniref:DUF6792 domain-containing protein n=1 Tax=Campylobacter concisus TaxID=199 RepID=UPI0015E16DF6|nr:DUF6792 domain-containing protein [Campylobacter concisus]